MESIPTVQISEHGFSNSGPRSHFLDHAHFSHPGGLAAQLGVEAHFGRGKRP